MNAIKSVFLHRLSTSLIVIGIAGCVTAPPVTNNAVSPNTIPTETAYVIQKGDTLAKIAQKLTGNADNWKLIAQHNNISNSSKLKVGQQLLIPANQPNLPANQSTISTNQSNASVEQSNRSDQLPQTSTPTDAEANPSLATIQGAVGGAMLAGVTAFFLSKGDHKATNVAIAAAGGAIAGGLLGSEIDKRRHQYASTEDFYDAQIRRTAQLNQALAENNRNLSTSIQADQNEINSLVAQYQAGRVTKDRLLASRQKIEQKIAKNKQDLAHAQGELKVQRDVSNELQAQGPGPRGNEMHRQVAQLEREINSLQQTVDQMASQSETLGRYM